MGTPPGPGPFKLINAKAGNCLYLSGGDNRKVMGFDYHGTNLQKWHIEQFNNGYSIRSVGSGKYLGIDGEVKNSTAVVGSDNPFAWDIKPDEKNSSVQRIFVPGTEHNVDLAGFGNRKPGTPIYLWKKLLPGVNQSWRIEQA